MIMYFIGRKKELKWLEEEYKSTGSNLVIVYGRRRIGKTSLVSKFLENKKGIYYLADESQSTEQLKEFSNILSNFTGVNVKFSSWYNAFDFLSKFYKNKNKLVIIIDEFPYLISSDPSVISKFQKIWDTLSNKMNIMLILLGSSISVMENKVLSHKSPLYGRRTAQIELKPFTISELMEFFKEDLENVVLKYGITDGIPAYADKIRNIKFPACLKEVLSPNKYLYNEVPFLLKTEFRETSIYKEILYAVANGRGKFGEISKFCNISGQKLPQYLKNLIHANIIKRTYPITQKKEFRGAKYILTDNYFDFWFRFIYPHRGSIERGMENIVYKEIMREYNAYMGRIFEKAILSIAERFIPFHFSKIGQWWEKDTEIDLVALNRVEKKIFFGEIKWAHGVDGPLIEKELMQKAEQVQWYNKVREEYFGIFAKSFKRKPKRSAAFDLKKIEKIIKTRQKG